MIMKVQRAKVTHHVQYVTHNLQTALSCLNTERSSELTMLLCRHIIVKIIEQHGKASSDKVGEFVKSLKDAM